MKTIICIATGQPLANLIPILQFNPQKIILIATESFKTQASSFRDILRNMEQNHRPLKMITGCPDTGIAEISQFVQQKVIPEIDDWDNLCVNLTGGTKLHSFALYQCLSDKAADILYVDTANRQLEHYPLLNQKGYTEPLTSLLDMKTTLLGMGKQRKGAESDSQQWCLEVERRKSLTHFFVEHIEELQPFIGSLNTIINGFYKDRSIYLRPATVDLFEVPKGNARIILEQGHDLGLVNWSKNKQLSFHSYNQARYFSGNWLEEYAWLCAQPVAFQEVACNVRFSNLAKNATDNTADNEIDLLAVHANAMLAVECKAASQAQKDDVSQNMFHKLSSVAHRAGGLMCSKLFLSAFSMTYKNGKDIASLNHAKEQSIHIVQGAELINLPNVLESWKNKGRFK